MWEVLNGGKLKLNFNCYYTFYYNRTSHYNNAFWYHKKKEERRDTRRELLLFWIKHKQTTIGSSKEAIIINEGGKTKQDRKYGDRDLLVKEGGGEGLFFLKKNRLNEYGFEPKNTLKRKKKNINTYT